nr:MAR-binding filament-like protein 1-1 [Coffea arabica]
MGQNRRKRTRISACMSQETGNERSSGARRFVLFVGFSVIPVLKLTAKAFESWPQDGSDLKSVEQDRRAEQKHQGDASHNPFVSLLSGLGILGSGVLGALYMLSLKEKATSEAAIESMRTKLKEKKLPLFHGEEISDQFAGLNSENEELKDKLLKNENELELKTAAVDDLNVQVGMLIAEKEESKRKFDAIKGEYNDLKSSSMKKAAEDAKLLEMQDLKLQQLEEQLESTSSELARELCLELEVEVSKVRADFAETKETLQKKAEEARRDAEVLAGELTSVKELLKEKTEEILNVSNELAAVVQTRDELQKELVDVYKKAESAANDLNEEKAIVASLNKELKALDTRVSKESEARKSLERNLEEATRSLNEINQNALILSRELELANSQISSLEDEKDALYKSLPYKATRAGKGEFGKRAKKLEEELAAAKGEILRLRSRINSSKTNVNDQHQQTVEVGAKAAAPVKRVARRRKAVRQKDESTER